MGKLEQYLQNKISWKEYIDSAEKKERYNMNSKEPLGLPKGSVRALLAFIIVGCVMGRVAFGQPVPEAAMALASAIAAAYGLSRYIETK